MERVNIKFAKTNPNAKIPEQVKGSAGLDFYACFDESYRVVEAHKTALIPTGLKMAIQDGYFVLLEERGSTGSKGIKRSAGVLDTDFRGNVFMAVTNSNDWDICIYKTDDDNINNMYDTMMEEARRDDEEWNKYYGVKNLHDETFQEAVDARFDENWNPKDNEEMHFYPYDKAIFQGIVLPCYEVTSEEVSEEVIDSMVTARGCGMLGSSGK